MFPSSPLLGEGVESVFVLHFVSELNQTLDDICCDRTRLERYTENMRCNLEYSGHVQIIFYVRAVSTFLVRVEPDGIEGNPPEKSNDEAGHGIWIFVTHITGGVHYQLVVKVC